MLNDAIKGVQSVDLTTLEPDQAGQWVVMSRSTRRVFAHGPKPTIQLLEEAKAHGCHDPILHKVMPFDRAFISAS